jgi:HAE1 family hydrophobic/amphiphilic exporter-1
VANVDIVEGPSEIRRIGQQRAAVVSANLNGVDVGTATKSIHTALSGLEWDGDTTYAISGQNAEMETSLNSLYFALALAVFLVYVVMASQFESFLHPFVILFAIPFALVGVIAVLWALDMPLNVMVFLGAIILAGIVVNNAIVLVDYVNHLRQRGMEKTEALVQAGSVRLRPILMTTMTTVLGLIPMAIGLGEGAEIRMPMAIAVIAGLVVSTVLTLVVIPTMYSILDRSS